MLKIGLTGGIGSGKSTVSHMIKSRGIPVIDSDIISREVIIKYPVIIKNIAAVFGNEFIDNEGALRRRELGNYVFQSEERKNKLEDIIIPYIKLEIFKEFDKYNKEGAKLCVLDAPTLIEKGLHKDMDINILVWVDKDTQVNRVRGRDKLTDEEIFSRIQSQIPLDKKRKIVDYIIDNSRSLMETENQLKDILMNVIDLRGRNEV